MSGNAREYFSKVWPRELEQLVDVLGIKDHVPHIAYTSDFAWYHCKAIVDVDREHGRLAEKILDGTIKRDEAEDFAKFMIPPTIEFDFATIDDEKYEAIILSLRHICKAFAQ